MVLFLTPLQTADTGVLAGMTSYVVGRGFDTATLAMPGCLLNHLVGSGECWGVLPIAGGSGATGGWMYRGMAVGRTEES